MPTTTTVEIRHTGGAYTSIQAAILAADLDLVAGDEILDIVCYKGDYSGSGGGVNYIEEDISISSFTTDSTRYISIRTDTSNRHNGALYDGSDFSGFTIVSPAIGSGVSTFRCNGQSYVRVSGLALLNAGTSGIGYSVSGATTQGIRIENCIGKTPNQAAFLAQNPTTGADCILHRNNLAEDSAIGFNISGPNKISLNNTAVGCSSIGFGFDSDASTSGVRIENCLASGNGTDFFDFGSGTPADLDYCADSDGSLGPYPGTGQRLNQTFTFKGATYLLTTEDTGAHTFGLDLSTDPDWPFSYDCLGNDRTLGSGIWDIGWSKAITYLSPNDLVLTDLLDSVVIVQNHIIQTTDLQLDVDIEGVIATYNQILSPVGLIIYLDLEEVISVDDLIQSLALDSATIVSIYILSPGDITLSQSLEPVIGFVEDSNLTAYQQLLSQPTSKREFLIHLRPFKLDS